MTTNCFTCGRAGHWAKDCPTGQCSKCGVPLHLHTQAGRTECAWRGRPCQDCGFPPHPDSAGGCDVYRHEGDSAEDRKIREDSPRFRSFDPGCFYRRPGPAAAPPPQPARDPDGELGPWRPRAEELMLAVALSAFGDLEP